MYVYLASIVIPNDYKKYKTCFIVLNGLPKYFMEVYFHHIIKNRNHCVRLKSQNIGKCSSPLSAQFLELPLTKVHQPKNGMIIITVPVSTCVVGIKQGHILKSLVELDFLWAVNKFINRSWGSGLQFSWHIIHGNTSFRLLSFQAQPYVSSQCLAFFFFYSWPFYISFFKNTLFLACKYWISGHTFPCEIYIMFGNC